MLTTGSLVCHHLQHRIISAKYDTVSGGQQRKPGKQQGGGLCTCNHPTRLAPLVRNRPTFLPPESHQCYATSTPIGNEAARVRHLKAVRVLRQVGEGFNTIASPETSHSRCRIYHLTCCLTLTSRPRCSISSPPAIASQRVPLSRPHSRWITVSCSWIAILFLHYLSLSTHPSHRPRLLASPRHPARVKESSLRIKGGECAHPAISKCMQNERAGGHLV